MPVDHQALIGRLVAALNALDMDGLDAILTEDYADLYPQSGEVVRGRSNFKAILQHLPRTGTEFTDVSTLRVHGTGEEWQVTPLFTVVRSRGAGSSGTAVLKTRYPDGYWWVIVLYELRGERIARATTLFAPAFEPAPWRAQFVEMPEGSSAR
jgi:hypothetical protein